MFVYLGQMCSFELQHSRTVAVYWGCATENLGLFVTLRQILSKNTILGHFLGNRRQISQVISV